LSNLHWPEIIVCPENFRAKVSGSSPRLVRLWAQVGLPTTQADVLKLPGELKALTLLLLMTLRQHSRLIASFDCTRVNLLEINKGILLLNSTNCEKTSCTNHNIVHFFIKMTTQNTCVKWKSDFWTYTTGPRLTSRSTLQAMDAGAPPSSLKYVFFCKSWWRQLAAGRSLNCVFCPGGWGERSCPRSATQIHSVAMGWHPTFQFRGGHFTAQCFLGDWFGS